MNWTPKGSKATRITNRVPPLARADKLVVEEVGDELLVYDLTIDRAHSLSATAARVWRACDGRRDVAKIAGELGVEEPTVIRALDDLRDSRLLEGEAPNAGNGMTRRDLTFRAAKVGVVASAVPMIVSIAAPVPAAAVTITPRECMLFTDKDCDNCTNICGCCCCGQAGGSGNEPSCKLCYTTSGCAGFTGLPGDLVAHCSSKAPDEPSPNHPHGNTCTRFSELTPHPDEPERGIYYDCKRPQPGTDDPTRVFLDETDRCCDYTDEPVAPA